MANNDGTGDSVPLVPGTPEPRERRMLEESESEDEDLDLELASSSIISVLIPVSICMALVVFVVRTVTFQTGAGQALPLVYDETAHASDSTGAKIGGALINALVIVVFIVLVTFLFVCLFKYGYTKIIFGWLMTSSTILLGFFGGLIFFMVLNAKNLPIDYLSFGILVWNFAAVGLMAIFWRGPLRLQQGYLILTSALLASSFSRLPEWTTWTLLAAVASYDVCAVLCPNGPLKMLVEIAQSRPNDPLPGLLYTSGVAYIAKEQSETELQEEEEEDNDEVNLQADSTLSANASVNGGPVPRTQAPQAAAPAARPDQPLARPDEQPLNRSSGSGGIKLGLGDFIFYSVLVARAAMSEWVTTFTCANVLLMGLCLTLLLLGVFRRALPALPISIALGIVFYFTSSFVLVPYVVELGLAGVHV